MSLEEMKYRRLRLEMVIKYIQDDIDEIEEWLKDKKTDKDKFILKKKRTGKKRVLQRKQDELRELEEEIQQEEMRRNMKGLWN